jgi:hypothetical protein
MAFDITPFLTPPPGPYQYRTPGALQSASEMANRAERARAADQMAAVQREAQEAANRRAMEANALELWKFQAGQEDKNRKEFDALLTEFGTALRNGDEAAANEVAQRMRAHGAQAVRIGGPQPSQQPVPAAPVKTPAEGAEQKPSTPSPAPEGDYSYSDLKPMPGVRPMPARAMPPGGPSATDLEQAQLRGNTLDAFNRWRAGREVADLMGEGEAPPPLVPPEPTLGQRAAQEAERRARIGAFQTQRALAAQPEARPMAQSQQGPVPQLGGMVSPMNQGVRPGWVVRKRGQEVFRLADTDVSLFRGRQIAEHFGPRLTGGTPDQKMAAKVGFDVASNAGGLPVAGAIQEGEKAYEFEMEQAGAKERAEIVARAKAASAARSQAADYTELRFKTMARISVDYKTPQLMEASRQTRNILELMSKPGAMQNGTTANFALTTALKAYGDSRISNEEFRLAADAPGLSAKVDSLMKWFQGKGRISDQVFINVREVMLESFKSQTDRLQQAAQIAHDQVAYTPGLPPAIGEVEGSLAAKGIYPEWEPKKPSLSNKSVGGRSWDKFR